MYVSRPLPSPPQNADKKKENQKLPAGFKGSTVPLPSLARAARLGEIGFHVGGEGKALVEASVSRTKLSPSTAPSSRNFSLLILSFHRRRSRTSAGLSLSPRAVVCAAPLGCCFRVLYLRAKRVRARGCEKMGGSFRAHYLLTVARCLQLAAHSYRPGCGWLARRVGRGPWLANKPLHLVSLSDLIHLGLA